MELLNAEIFGAVKSLGELFDMELPVRTSLSLAKLIGKLDGSFREIERVRIGLVNKYGERSPKTNQIEVTPENENFPKFIEEYNELMAQSTEIVFDVVRLPQEVDGKPLLIKPSLMVSLGKFIDVESQLKVVNKKTNLNKIV